LTLISSKGPTAADEGSQIVDIVRLFQSYREAELHGYYSLKRLKALGLSVPDSIRPNYKTPFKNNFVFHGPRGLMV
jgi:hypothetical protein